MFSFIFPCISLCNSETAHKTWKFCLQHTTKTLSLRSTCVFFVHIFVASVVVQLSLFCVLNASVGDVDRNRIRDMYVAEIFVKPECWPGLRKLTCWVRETKTGVGTIQEKEKGGRGHCSSLN